jgi:hypothetical protein
MLTMLVAVCLALSLLWFDVFQPGTYGDDAHYIVTARALASGLGYSLINFPDAPAEVAFPPGFPALLVVPTLIASGSAAALKAVSLLFTLAALPLWFHVLRRILSPGHAWMVMLCVAVSPLVVGHAVVVMSESLFFFLVAGCLLVSEKVAARGKVLWAWSFVLV